MHVASLDLRQHSDVHARVVDELLHRGGRPGYVTLSEDRRVALLAELLSRPAFPRPDHGAASSADAEELFGTLRVVGRARRELGTEACERYIVSFTRS